jgi:hypothetical protein
MTFDHRWEGEAASATGGQHGVRETMMSRQFGWLMMLLGLAACTPGDAASRVGTPPEPAITVDQSIPDPARGGLLDTPHDYVMPRGF